MRYTELIKMSRVSFNEQPEGVVQKISFNIFTVGAVWMCNQLNKTGNTRRKFNTSVNYTVYGLLKYGSCIILFLITAIFLAQLSILLIPLSVFVFYFVEVHFLFLFPLLIDGTKYPLKESIKQTYRLGLIKSMVTVFQISCYMLIGLLNPTNPTRNWYIGCLAIIIWYQNDVRNRI